MIIKVESEVAMALDDSSLVFGVLSLIFSLNDEGLLKIYLDPKTQKNERRVHLIV